ncbi:MAG: PhoPQ-activated protein PqaA family protein [Gammaproteobacteria bacterium]|nr:PhoPQ-activated protein PqaA family protein [Gammaproteobacteria bacterium]
MRTTLATLLASLCLSTSAAELAQRTLLDDYVKQDDDSHAWQVAASKTLEGTRIVVLDMVSQHWLTKPQVDRTEWRHWLRLSIPPTVSTDIAFLYIQGGGNNSEAPADADPGMVAIANATGSVVAELGMVPNQPLSFDGDGVPRWEDDLIAYNWARSLTGDGQKRLVLEAMTKSAVRAMDTVTAVMARPEWGERLIERFVVSGGSKRGWTSWLTAAVDERVVAIAPIVFDVLNMEASIRHHFAAYGHFSQAVADFALHGILPRVGQRAVNELMWIADPYRYRHRVTVPKLILNASGDEFFLPDSSRFYWDELRGENYLRYVPNAPHSMSGTDALDTVAAFHWLVVNDQRPPRYSWAQRDDGTLQVMPLDQPQGVLLWQATNPEARDFRLATLGRAFSSTPVEADTRGMYTARVPAPERGWSAWFLELTYDVGAPKPLKLTTEVVVTPDVLPFEGKPLDLPTSITIACSGADPASARDIGVAVVNAPKEDLDTETITTEVLDDRLYVNWTPSTDSRASAVAVAKFLETEGCTDGLYQLESGEGMTLPPVR